MVGLSGMDEIIENRISLWSQIQLYIYFYKQDSTPVGKNLWTFKYY